jgi:hypothetical protein
LSIVHVLGYNNYGWLIPVEVSRNMNIASKTHNFSQTKNYHKQNPSSRKVRTVQDHTSATIINMSKQQQSPNTAEYGCGNGFSLTAAISLSLLSSPIRSSVSSPTQLRARPSIDRAILLSIIEDAIQITNGEFDEQYHMQEGNSGLSAQ